MSTSVAHRQAPVHRRGKFAATVGVIGELMITAGVVIALFVVYELVWTGQQTANAQDRLTSQLSDQFADPAMEPSTQPVVPAAPTPTTEPSEPAQPVAAGDGLGILRIPRLGDSWQWAYVEGVDRDDLKKGPGHYPDTVVAGEVGNFSLAGHRRTYGQPFVDLDTMEQGDRVYIQDGAGYFVYEVDRQTIVLPSAVDVVAPVPQQPGVQASQKLITLTTCWPKNGSSKRLVVFGHLVESTTRDQGPPAGFPA